MPSLGWIKFHRKSLESRVFRNSDLWKVWTWCLLKANHEKGWVSLQTGRGVTEIEVMPGQFVFGRSTAAKELRMPESSVWKRMLKLKSMQNLNIESDSHYSMITIINWDTYQADDNKSDREGDTQVTGKEQARNTNKNDKNEKNEKNKDTPPISPTAFHLPGWMPESLWREFLSHRKSVKAPVTKDSYSRFIAKFQKLKDQGWDPEMVISYMAEKGWRWFDPDWIKEKKYGDQKTDSGYRNLLFDPDPEEGD